MHIPLNQALPLLAPQNYSPCPWCDLRRIPKCIFQDVLHDGTFYSLWPHSPGVIPVLDSFSHFERSEQFFPRKLWQVWRAPKPCSVGEWKKGREWYNEGNIWKESRPEACFWFILLAKSVSRTDKIWDNVHKAELPLAIIHTSRLKPAQISRLIDGKMHQEPCKDS